MSGQSDKKAKKSAGISNTIYLIMIFFATSIYIICHLYKYYIKKQEDIFTKKEIFGFVFLSFSNYLMYKLLNLFRNSFWDKYLLDFLGLNCLIEIMINYSKKFWYLYLIYPGYLLWKGIQMLLSYVGNIGKVDELGNEIQEEQSGYKDKGHKAKQVNKEKKQKIKYVKY